MTPIKLTCDLEPMELDSLKRVVRRLRDTAMRGEKAHDLNRSRAIDKLGDAVERATTAHRLGVRETPTDHLTARACTAISE